jgi:hypothetical protein
MRAAGCGRTFGCGLSPRANVMMNERSGLGGVKGARQIGEQGEKLRGTEVLMRAAGCIWVFGCGLSPPNERDG